MMVVPTPSSDHHPHPKGTSCLARCSTRRVPRGFIDPIESRADALAVLSLAAPFGDDTVAILLDTERRGIGIVVVTGTTDPDAIFGVIDVCVNARYTRRSPA